MKIKILYSNVTPISPFENELNVKGVEDSPSDPPFANTNTLKIITIAISKTIATPSIFADSSILK
ncbi:hypothetical protein D3C76_919190 [compost metagenome]